MTLPEILASLDKGIEFFTDVVAQKQNSSDQLAGKDKQIADLTAQLQTANATAQADESQIQQLNDKLTNLSSLIAQASSSSTTTVPTQASTAAPNKHKIPSLKKARSSRWTSFFDG